MHDFSEKLLQFIWQHRLLKPSVLKTVSGQDLTILSTGDLNHNAGPDFFNGRIRLEGISLAGNIELHLKTSDWLKHGHQRDKSYDHIILHVVYEHDLVLTQNSENNVPVLELKNLVPETILARYEQLMANKQKLACANQIGDVDEFKFISWMERMAIERLEEKVKRIEQYFTSYKGDYAQTFYTLLLRNFGFNVNSVPFELIAKHLPVQLLLKHADNLLQLEAMLLGVAGMLDDLFSDKHMRDLQNEFAHLKNKYSLVCLQKNIFKFSRTRPANFADVRLRQFALLVHNNTSLLISPQHYTDPAALKKTLRLKTENTIRATGSTNEVFGEDSADSVMINTFAPFFFFYSKKLAKPGYSDLSIRILTQAGFEKNAKTRLFCAKQSLLKSAADSQAIINLYDHYCAKKNCLNCGVAAALLKSA